MKVYNLFYYSNDYSLDFWGSFSSELMAIDKIVSYIKRFYEFKNNTFEQSKRDLSFKSTEKKEKIINDITHSFLNGLNNAGSIEDILLVIKKVKNDVTSAFTPFVYSKTDETVLYYKFSFLLGTLFNENSFRIIETEINEEIDINIFN